MNHLNSSSSESMKALTDKVIKADLASRKKRFVGQRAARMYPFLVFPLVYYTVKVIYNYLK